MKIANTIFAYVLAVAVTYVLSVAFYTQQVIAKMAAIGAVYSPQQKIDTFVQNFLGLAFRDQPSLGMMLAVALAIGFAVGFVVKRIIKPLAPVAYPVAGAAAVVALLVYIEGSVAGGGAGVIGGARDAVGLSLQGLAGFLGGAAFAFKRPR
ncbi:hypothetical protein [Hyphococcus luteus]|uniref:Uncharacterized protein n=1 Tax=Hyphococcus luteus TaxID=2058213 RepID=A0A2S7K7H8_9PROT|nr:hypothetical protein [Marinicaulis flavus]PQA88442.1 hypothetical protein CW354_09125 [Marinicaulis flavus]